MKSRPSVLDLVCARLPRRGDDRGSMAMVIMVILIGLSLGGLMLSMIITQTRATHFDTTRVRSLHAAQTGVDIVLGEIRASTAPDAVGNIFGDDGGLPCGPISGNANGAGTGAYSVSIAYYVSDPNLGAPPKMQCVSGYGPYDATSSSRTPRFALLTSTGTDGAATNGTSKGRTIVTTYVFQTDDTNIPGGFIRLFPDSSGNLWCMDAGSPVPAAGAAILLRACSSTNPPAPQQVFAYRKDLSIQLVSSVTAANLYGLCVDTNSATHTAGVAMVLKKCTILDPSKCAVITNCSPWNQQWSVDDNAHLEGALTDKSNIDGYCINAGSQTDGVALTLASCAGGVTDPKQTWVPSPTAGAGMAGATNGQLVNYKQFAMCIDVTGQDPNAAYLILYTCKQNPDPTKVSWNQKFAPSPALGAAPTRVLLKTTSGGTTYCLTSPLSNGGYARVTTPCPSSVATAGSNFIWTMYTTQDASGLDLPYSQKYTIVDSSGASRCLGPGQNTDLLNGQYYKVVTTPCDGSTGQKWNANPSLDAATLTNTHES